MIEYIKGDVLNSGEAVVVHGCNCFNTMGSGIARQVREEYPEACQIDALTVPGDRSKLGLYTTAVGKNGTRIINAYTQYGYSRTEVSVDYNAVESVMELICEHFPETPRFAMPKIGAGLAGGDWNIIEQILERVATKYNKTFAVYIYENVYPVGDKPDFIKWREELNAAKEKNN